MTAETDRIALQMWITAQGEEQCARIIEDDEVADDVRAEVRRLAAGDGIRVRTARMNNTVIVVRLDATVWTDDAATMRWKLAPSG